MRITDIKVFPVREEKLKAFVSIVFDECFMINDIKVIRGKEGYFISMPSRRKRNGKFKDIAHPLNNETRQAMEKEILSAYEEAVDEVSAAPRELKPEASRDKPRPERSRPAEPVRPERTAAPEPVVERAEQESDFADGEPATPTAPAAVATKEDSLPSEPAGDHGKSLEEVAEHHLRDSFWST